MSRIAPRTGMIVIDPATGKPLAAIGVDGRPGEYRDLTDPYWYRRVQDGDVTILEAEPQPVAAPVESPVDLQAEKPKRKKSTDEGK